MRNLIATLMLGSVLLTGCMSTPKTPEHLVIQQPTAGNLQAPTMQAVNLQVRDQRTQNHILRVEHTDDKAEFATSTVPLATLISDAMADFWPNDDSAQVQFTVYLEEALILVYPDGGNYRAEHEMATRLVVRSGDQWVSRRYVTRVAGGPYKRLDYGHLNDTFNKVVQTNVRDMFKDAILQEWLAEHVR